MTERVLYAVCFTSTFILRLSSARAASLLSSALFSFHALHPTLSYLRCVELAHTRQYGQYRNRAAVHPATTSSELGDEPVSTVFEERTHVFVSKAAIYPL